MCERPLGFDLLTDALGKVFPHHTPTPTALEHCERGLELNDRVWEVHQWYAIAIGSLTKYEGAQRKIEMGYKYKARIGCILSGRGERGALIRVVSSTPQEHIDKAISLRPDEKTLHHLRGRFCFEVCVCVCVFACGRCVDLSCRWLGCRGWRRRRQLLCLGLRQSPATRRPWRAS